MHTYRIRGDNILSGIQHFKFGYEAGSIAASIASGTGFASPFGGATGPTAWLAPVYPYLIACVFKLFGIYSSASALALLTLNSLFSALTCIPVYLIARQLFDSRVAKWTAWSWALLPSAMYWAIKWIWDTSLSTLLLTTALWLTFKLDDDRRLRWWFLWGGLWALLALTNPSCCSVLPFAGAWLWWRHARRGQRAFWRLALSALVFVLMITPWEVRNYRAFHRLVPLRDNFAAELRMGNGPHANGLWLSWAHPSQTPVQLAEYRRLGETNYILKKRAEALSFILERPWRFIRLSLFRVVYFWAGIPKAGSSAGMGVLNNWFYILVSTLSLGGLLLVVTRGLRGAFLLVAATALYPVVYYFTFTDPRYRHPIEPLLLMLAAKLVSECQEFHTRVAGDVLNIVELEPAAVSTRQNPDSSAA